MNITDSKQATLPIFHCNTLSKTDKDIGALSNTSKIFLTGNPLNGPSKIEEDTRSFSIQPVSKEVACDRLEPSLSGDSREQTWIVSAELGHAYEIRQVEPLLDPRNTALIDVGESRQRRLIVLDEGVPDCFRKQMQLYFSENQVAAKFVTIQGGENCKSFEMLRYLIGAFDAFGLNRQIEPIIIFGGGAVLDVAGFAASIYRRGIPFVRVPTTLLAFVDASVGVKTGINFGNQKNLVGSFTPPLTVFLERNFLSSLNNREIASGLGEILKLAVGCDANLLDMLEANAAKFHARDFDDDAVKQILFRSIDIMLGELAPNIYENNLCRVVDLGHTFSQVFEMLANGSALRHGEAVAVDVNLSAFISMHRGMLSREDVYRIVRVTECLGLPTTLPDTDPHKIWDSVVERTCHRGGQQRIPIPRCLGECIFINNLEYKGFTKALKEFRSGCWREKIFMDSSSNPGETKKRFG